MSHFVVMVIGNDVEAQLARYDESIEVEKYSQGLVTEEQKQEMLEYYKGKGKFKSFDECYAQFGDEWNGGRYEKNNKGEWEKLSIYNPDSKWDWYMVGGRWAGMLKLKKGAKKIKPLSFSWGWNENKKDEMREKNLADVAYKRDIANLSEIVPFAIVKDGEWYERGECGWWGAVSGDKSIERWGEEVNEILSHVSDDELITIVDCHI